MNIINKLKKGKRLKILTVLFPILLFAVGLHAQNSLNIKGRVMDTDGNVLPGTAVLIQGATVGAVTNDDGDYVLSGVPVGSVLEFKLVGFVTQTVKVTGDRTVINAILLEAAESLEEITVVAFGEQKRESVIASVETVRVADLKQPSSNLTSSFAGRIPGIISYQTSGEPGADNAQFFIRGVTTFGYKSDPLILIDGFEASTDDLARMQPDDIESFSILKDASATVLYGARGANGIITVTTKSGAEGNVKVSARIDVNIATPTAMLELLDGIEYMRLYNQARTTRNPKLGNYYSEQKIQATEQGLNPMIFPNIDWYDAMFNRATVNEKANINLSGGGKAATYYVAGGFDHESGLLKVEPRNNFNSNIDIKRYHIRSNVIFKLTSTTLLDTRISGRFQKYFGPHQSADNIFRMTVNANPVDFPPVYEPDEAHLHTGHTLFGNTYLSGNSLKFNPYAEMVRGYKESDESTISAQATLKQDLDFLTKGLKVQAKASVSTYNYHEGIRTYSPFYYALESSNIVTGAYTLYNLNPGNPNDNLGNVSPKRDGNTHYYFEVRFNWARQFGKHSLGLMTVGMAEENILTNGSSTSIYETLPERNLGNSGRITYDYDLRYFLELSYGYNGSEKFTGSKRFGFFPSAGAGWLVSNEKFWQPLKNTVSLLKFKFTVGKVGNDAIAGRAGRFFYLSDINYGDMTGSGYFLGQTFTDGYPGYTIGRYANPDITWEESTKYNLGLELGFLKGEPVKLQVDVFKDIRDKIYWERENFPATSGFEKKIQGNVGKVESHGVDASLDIQHSFDRDFWVTGRANFTYATNRVLEKDEPNYPYEYLKRVGHHTDQQWGLVAERLFVDAAEVDHSPEQDYGLYQAGDIKYLDVNKDGVVNSNDQIAMGYPKVPEIQYGFGLSAGYKNFDISFFFQGSARTSFFIDPGSPPADGDALQIKQGIAAFVDRRNAPAIVANNAWSETNPDPHALWPRLSTDLLENNRQSSSWWLRDGSFLRLKSVEIGYALPAVEKLFIKNARVYVTLENLLYFSSFKLWDPEVGSNGLGYPINRRFNVGLLLNF
ncbi:MAG: TonB-dependent receptor [Prevotella sp.]|jgi:TonB-linked SusC/RagA family outer membrane protein|nr:TonB-dependent receptor [Prevotella sp.]